MIRWSKTTTEAVTLDQFQDKQSFFNSLDLIQPKGGGNQVYKALNLLVDNTLSRTVSRDVARYEFKREPMDYF